MGALIFYATSGFLPSPSGCRESGEGVGASASQCARGALLVALPSSPRDNGPIQEHPVKGAFTRGRIGFETIFSARTQQKNPAMRQHCGIFVLAPEQKICVSKLPLAPFLHLMANIPPVKSPWVLLFFSTSGFLPSPSGCRESGEGVPQFRIVPFLHFSIEKNPNWVYTKLKNCFYR